MVGSARLLRWSCVAVAAAATAALIGKLLNVPLLAGAFSLSIPMAPSTAVAFLLLAAALHPDLPWSRFRRARLGLLLPVFVISIPALEVFAARYLKGGWVAVAASLPFEARTNLWSMSPLTAGLFFVVGVSVAAHLRRGPGRVSPVAAWGAALAAASAIVILIGYLYRVPLFYGGLIIPMAATTAACFLVLSAALLAEFGRGLWPWSLFEGDSPRALMMRSFLPLGAGIIFAMGLVDSRIELSGAPLTSAAIMIGAVLGTAWLVAGISARVGIAIEAAERRLGASEERTQTIIRTAMDGFWMADLEGRLLVVNDAYCRMSGYSREELLSMRIPQLESSENAIDTAAHIRRIIETGEDRFETRHRRKDGTTFPLEIGVQYKADDGGRLIAFLCDITERTRAEEVLRESEARFRTLIERAPEAVFVQEGGRFVYLNPAAVRIFGAARAEELVGREFLPLIAPEYHDAIRERIRLQKTTGGAAPLMEQDYLRLDGARIPVETTAVPIRYQGKDAYVVFVRDISERKRMEAEGFRMQKLESLGVLAGGIAHDFNNMLTAVLGNLALLKEGAPSGGERLEIAQEAMNACLSAKGLAKQLLTFASGGAPVVAVVDLAALVREAATFAARGTSVRCEISAAGDCFAKVDKDQVAQVVQNLVLNAVHSMPTGGTVLLDLARVGDFIRLRVKDAGAGISKGHLPRIFDPFFSTKGTSRGLGLSMCHSIVTKHGGRIGVDSRLGEGTTFTVHLPAAAPSERSADPATHAVQTGSGRVLIMDDEKSVVQVLGRMLLKLGYDSEAAADGEAAIALFLRAREAGTPFDAVLMDLTISGGMGGKEAVQRLLELDPRARVIVSSGYSDDPVVADFEKHGFCGALIKPYMLAEVSAALTHALPAKDSAAAGPPRLLDKAMGDEEFPKTPIG